MTGKIGALRRSYQLALFTILLLGTVGVEAAEKGLVIRAGDLLAQPFIDAANVGKVAPAEPVTVVERRGAWANVKAGGKSGWVRLLNLRLEPTAGLSGPTKAQAVRPNGLTALLQTGSSGRTVTTGVKGMDEEDIKNATPNYVELTLLETLEVDAANARSNAVRNNLKERSVDYLDKRGGK